MKKRKISLAIASAVLLSATGVSSASAVGQKADRLTEPGTAANIEGGHRFLVRYKAGSVEARNVDAVDSGLKSAISRAGLTRSLPGTNTSSSQGVVTAGHLRKMALPRWNVVTTSRSLDPQEAADFMRELAADPAVESVEIDRMYQHMQMESPSFDPNDPDYRQRQWNFHDPVGGVRAPEAWDIANGAGTVVAVLDTGIVRNHFDLQANVIPGYDMITDRRVSRRAEDGRVPGGWDLGDWVTENYCMALGHREHPAKNSGWHGSHVAGTVAQETDNRNGLAGLAHGARVMPVRVLGSCGGFSADIADAIIWAAGGEVPGVPVNENPAEIINMSLGSRDPQACPRVYQEAIDEALALGSIIVVAAGNNDADASRYTMSSCNNVINVGATNIFGNKAGYSNWGARVDLSAPGGDDNGFITQVTNAGREGPTNQWVLRGMQGTSMASPHVAAVAAMVQGALVDAGRDPLDWRQMRDLLTATASPFRVAQRPAMGAGILDARAALDRALGRGDDDGDDGDAPCNPAVEACGGPEARRLVNGEAVFGLSGATGSESLYRIEVPAGVNGPLTIATIGGAGDVDLLVSHGQEPTQANADHRSLRPGNNDTVRINRPVAGTYYIKLVGARAYRDALLLAWYD